MVVIGEKWWYLGKSGCILEKWLYSGIVGVFGQSGCDPEKVVELLRKWLYSL